MEALANHTIAAETQQELHAERIACLWDIAMPFVERYRREFERVRGPRVRFYGQPFSVGDESKIKVTIRKLEYQKAKTVNTVCNHFEELFNIWKPPSNNDIFDELKESFVTAMIAGTLEPIVGSSDKDTKKHFGEGIFEGLRQRKNQST